MRILTEATRRLLGNAAAVIVPGSTWRRMGQTLGGRRVRSPRSLDEMPAETKTPHDRFIDQMLAAGAQESPVFETGIPMRDGVELAADVYLPTKEELPTPAIVTITP